MRSFRITRAPARRLGGFFCAVWWILAGVLLARDTAKVRTELEVTGILRRRSNILSAACAWSTHSPTERTSGAPFGND
jgi:hypothetical protein